jgi:hypothetical protein
MKKTICTIVVISTILSCKSDTVKFEQPQPESEKALSSFNLNIQGVYINLENPSDELFIESKIIRSQNVLSFSCLKSDLEIDSTENVDITNDQEIIDYLTSEGGNATIRNDSIFYKLVIVDTLFHISDDQILKRFARNYFLNYWLSDNYWKVQKIEMIHDTLLIGEITPSDTLLFYDFAKKQDRIINEDSVVVHDYILNPNKKDMRMMLRSKSFDKVEKFIRK